MKEHQSTEHRPETSAVPTTGAAGSPTPETSAAGRTTPQAAAADATEQQRLSMAAADGTSVYVRRRRRPTLAFWVVLLLLIAFFGGALGAVLRGALSPAALFNTALLAALVIGVPLAAVAAFVDMMRHRRR